eukprot:10017506-Prorocentrum_lima.AAC.1
MTDPEIARSFLEFRRSWTKWVEIVSEDSLKGKEYPWQVAYSNEKNLGVAIKWHTREQRWYHIPGKGQGSSDQGRSKDKQQY